MRLVLILTISLLTAFSGVAQDQKYNQKDANGKRHGMWVETWPKSTIKKWEGEFDHGEMVGQFRFWYQDGELKSKVWYLPDSVVRMKMYHPTGYLMAKGKYIGEKKKDSTWLYYDDRGRINIKEEYKNGKLHGKRQVYYVDPTIVKGGKLEFEPGNLYMVETFENGVRDGKWIEYFYGGRTKVEGEYVDGNLEGQVMYYYPNGKKEKILHFKHAVKHGFQYFFNKNGVEEHRRFYLNGRELKDEELEEYLKKSKERRDN